eukprot:3715272-Rhodomonas_salina.1
MLLRSSACHTRALFEAHSGLRRTGPRTRHTAHGTQHTARGTWSTAYPPMEVSWLYLISIWSSAPNTKSGTADEIACRTRRRRRVTGSPPRCCPGAQAGTRAGREQRVGGTRMYCMVMREAPKSPAKAASSHARVSIVAVAPTPTRGTQHGAPAVVSVDRELWARLPRRPLALWIGVGVGGGVPVGPGDWRKQGLEPPPARIPCPPHRRHRHRHLHR